jgi:hypothetical protein
VVAMNFAGTPQMMSPDLTSRGVKGRHLKKLAASFAVPEQTELGHIILPAYSSYVGQVEP